MQPNNSQFQQPPAPGAPQPAPNFGQAPQTMQIPGQPMPQQVAPGIQTQQMNPGVQPQQFPNQQPLGTQGLNPNETKPKNPSSTQNSLQLSEVRDGMVIMNDGSFRAVITCKSINFDLMSDREREGVEYSYQNFLNSLNFPIQILVRSQRVDIGPYIDRLVATRRSQDNMLLGVLMDDYINFIDALSDEANIMEKSFYIVVPYFPMGDSANLVEQGKGFFGKLFPKQGNTTTRIDANTYQKAKDEIKNRVDSVMAGLFQIGVQSVQLDTKSLGELYYNYYNPDTAVRQPIGDFDNLATTFVKKGPSQNPSPELGQVNNMQQGGVQ